MFSWSRFIWVWKARNLEFFRDRSALMWNLAFPVLVVFGFSFAFSGKGQEQFKVAIVAPTAQTTQLLAQKQGIFGTDYIQFVPTESLTPTLEKLKRHSFDLVLQPDPTSPRYWINSTSPKGYLVERILWGTEQVQDRDSSTKNVSLMGGSHSHARYSKQQVSGREVRYVDWLIAGLMGMNMMMSALFGVGFVIVRYRKNGVLKRLKATPLTALEFLSAQVASRLFVIVITSAGVFLGCHAILQFQMLGSWLLLLLILTLGAICLISVGLVIAARVTSEEFAGGLLNLVSWPMMFLSGVWFSLDGAHPWVQKAATVFPLTHVISAARAVMNEGANLREVTPQLVLLSAVTVVCLGLGAKLFRWDASHS